jgi:hypothetical protein
MLVLVDGIGEEMIRFTISKILANLTPGKARETFMRRLVRSRFAAAATLH